MSSSLAAMMLLMCSLAAVCIATLMTLAIDRSNTHGRKSSGPQAVVPAASYCRRYILQPGAMVPLHAVDLCCGLCGCSLIKPSQTLRCAVMFGMQVGSLFAPSLMQLAGQFC